MADIFSAHRGFWKPERKHSLRLGVLLLALSLIVHLGAGRYSARSSVDAPFVGDLFLDNLPTVNLDFVIVEIALFFWIVAWFLMGFRPRFILFGVKAVALFIIFRAFFISLTHIGIYPEQTFSPGGALSGFYGALTFQGNFFFSGHTGFPFLLMLVFWSERIWRRVFFASTLVFAASVLFAHVHYSIDVFAAPFITYGIYRIAAKLWPEDYELTLAAGRPRGS